MADKNDLFDFDESTASNNDNVQGANIAENCAPSGINNAIRGLAAIVKRALGSQGGAIASAATTAIGAAGTALYATVTGTAPITSLGVVGAGTFRIIEFTNALTLTHNATSLKLPGAANITTANGDVGFFVSLGSGNWKCLGYLKGDGRPVVSSIASAAAGTLLTLTSTDAGAGVGPDIDLFRNSASPANADVLGAINFKGKNDGGGIVTYGRIVPDIGDAVATSEDGHLTFQTVQAGALTSVLTIALGVQIGLTAADKGGGTLNVSNGLYVDGAGVHAQLLHLQHQEAANTAGGTWTLGSFQTRTLNTKITDEIGSTLSANQFTLPAGQYWIEAEAAGFAVDSYRLKLRNVTDSSDTLLGMTHVAGAAVQTSGKLRGRFTIATQKTFELQGRCQTTNAGDGFGSPANFGTEVYADVRVYKVGG